MKSYTAHSIMRGKTLERPAVLRAKAHNKERLQYLLGKNRLALTNKERAEARQRTGMFEFWNYGKREAPK